MNTPRSTPPPSHAQGRASALRRHASAPLRAIVRLSTTRLNYWLEVAVSASLSLALLATGLWRYRGPWAGALLVVLAGLLVFSFIEYLFHRWVFHGPDSPFQRGHQAHHLDPRGYDALPFFLPAAILLGLMTLFRAVLPTAPACLLGGTIGLGYVAYGLSHFAMHATRFRQPWLMRWAARHHIHHHHPDRNFGVTSALWDHVLGTGYRPRR